ncbi:hypothetical protein L2E82_13286 [Cichorium intybus]|uniref:Uncharacterized protein n=1 Tax=Cichorium intybus TaxID=13427 RepID=A0ACB9GJP5_CICIN|nr:hypothetical protein L2E82_13286 [Cichorium intybus]
MKVTSLAPPIPIPSAYLELPLVEHHLTVDVADVDSCVKTSLVVRVNDVCCGGEEPPTSAMAGADSPAAPPASIVAEAESIWPESKKATEAGMRIGQQRSDLQSQ